MLFGQDRNQLRQMYIDSWHRRQTNQPLEPLQTLIADVVAQHPEYQSMLEDQDRALSHDYIPEQGETNPFLHMGMHIAIHEQLQTGRPAGIVESYQRLVAKLGDTHEAEHQMMECLGQVMWEAQRSGKMPDDQEYLHCLKRLS
jgi:hypothetical protein